MLQDIEHEGDNHGGVYKTLPSFPRKETQNKFEQMEIDEELPECYVGQRKCPDFAICHFKCHDDKDVVDRSHQSTLLWILLRELSCMEGQQMPSWSGYYYFYH